MGIAIGFLVPPILVPNVDDVTELAYHIRIMFYISAGVATLIFVLVVIGKSSGEDDHSCPLAHRVGKSCWCPLLNDAIIAHCKSFSISYNSQQIKQINSI